MSFLRHLTGPFPVFDRRGFSYLTWIKFRGGGQMIIQQSSWLAEPVVACDSVDVTEPAFCGLTLHIISNS